MSRTVSTYPIVGAMVALEKLIGSGRQWVPINATQSFFIQRVFGPGRSELSTLAAIEGVDLDQIASTVASEINNFLAEHGFNDIQLDEFESNEVGAAAAMEVALCWAIKGKRTSISTPDQVTYPAFQLVEGSVSFLRSSQHSEPIARLATKNQNLFVYATPFEETALPKQEFALIGLTRQLLDGAQADYRYESLVIPMIDLKQEVDISWLLGMKSPPWFISQAKQQTIFKMNELGFLAKSAAAVGARKCAIGGPLIIDKPFLAWIEYKGLTLPLLSAYVTEEDWKDPGTIVELGQAEDSDPHASRDGEEPSRLTRGG